MVSRATQPRRGLSASLASFASLARAQRAPDGWPEPLSRAAMHGLAGDFVRAVAPQSEADPAALLIQFLAAFGNVIGHGPHWMAEADRHSLNLYVVVVGRTAKGRKGTSLGQVKARIGAADPAWSSQHIASGLSSGEGLVWRVRDGASHQMDASQWDEGEHDKRLMVEEPEFASVLQAMQRQGNTLSPVVRNGWDSGNLECLTKRSPVRATGAHITILGHITLQELHRHLNATEIANGFANRFLYACAKRSQFLPDGGNHDSDALAAIDERIKMAVAVAQGVGELKRDERARARWHEVYPELGADIPGLLGAVTSRAEAQVMRLACIYALLDKSAVVRIEHLEAALEVWRYCFDSAVFIFGQDLGDPVAERILRAIEAEPDGGLSRTEIVDLFSGHKDKGSVERALGVLRDCGLAHPRQLHTGGRPAERWYPGPEREQSERTKEVPEPDGQERGEESELSERSSSPQASDCEV